MSEPIPSLLYRHGAPTIYDQAPFGTLCKVMTQPIAIYIQNSNDADNPKWELFEE